MKSTNRLFVVMLALIMVLTCALAEEDASGEAFTFRNSSTRDTPADGIAEAAGVEQSALFTMQGETVTGYMLQGAFVFSTPAVLSYYCKLDQLALVCADARV